MSSLHRSNTRAKRIAVYGGVAITVIAYTVLVPMKWHGLLPAKMTWLRVVVGPILLSAMPLVAFLTEGKSARTILAWWSVVALLVVLLMLLDPVPR